MKRIVILGCENSHAKNFLNEIKANEAYSDYEVLGVFSENEDSAKKLNEEFGVPVMKSYDEAVGKVDGVIVTARHGANHYKYAKPYIKSGAVMFIDKPITIDCNEALEFMRELKANGVKVSGGSSLGKAEEVIALAESARAEKDGKTVGGVFRAPLKSASPNGGIYFYAAHLVEMVSCVFGRYPKSLKAFAVDDQKTVIFRYDNYDIVGIFVESSAQYYASRFSAKGVEGGVVTATEDWFRREFAEFDALMNGGEQNLSYDDFISSVFVMRAIEKSLASGNEEVIEKYKV